MFDFGMRIQQLRTQHKLSQEALGKKLGKSKSVICTYENNYRTPPLEVLTNMAAIFHVSLDYLVGIDKSEMVSIEGLSGNQKQVIRALVEEFQRPPKPYAALTDKQQEILNSLLVEFSKRR